MNFLLYSAFACAHTHTRATRRRWPIRSRTHAHTHTHVTRARARMLSLYLEKKCHNVCFLFYLGKKCHNEQSFAWKLRNGFLREHPPFVVGGRMGGCGYINPERSSSKASLIRCMDQLNHFLGSRLITNALLAFILITIVKKKNRECNHGIQKEWDDEDRAGTGGDGILGRSGGPESRERSVVEWRGREEEDDLDFLQRRQSGSLRSGFPAWHCEVGFPPGGSEDGRVRIIGLI